MAFLSRVNLHRSHKQRKWLKHHQAFVVIIIFFLYHLDKMAQFIFRAG